jgi:hypothetical protein
MKAWLGLENLWPALHEVCCIRDTANFILFDREIKCGGCALSGGVAALVLAKKYIFMFWKILLLILF